MKTCEEKKIEIPAAAARVAQGKVAASQMSLEAAASGDVLPHPPPPLSPPVSKDKQVNR